MPAGKYHGTYDPEKVIVTIGDNIITGFTAGDFITAKYDDDRYFKIIGVDGEVGRIRNPSNSGTVEITLMASSEANQWFSANGIAEKYGINKPFNLGIRDLSGKTVLFSEKSWIKSYNDISFSDEISDRVWTIDCADLMMVIGGSNSNSLFDSVVATVTDWF